MNPELLGVQLAKSGIIVVDGVAAGFGMPAGQLQRILPGQRILGPFGRRHISGVRRIKSLRGACHNFVEKSSIRPLGVGNG